jgi:hypothetical protein
MLNKKAALSAAATFILATSAHASTVQTVFVIALENHNFTQPSTDTSTQQLFGNPAAPYLNSLITKFGAARSWKSYQEDSQLNSNGTTKSTYTVPLASVSGINGPTNPYNGSNQFNYAAKHNPHVFFSATNGASNSSNYAPLQQLQTDLTNNTVAKYNWITPNRFNDMHTALNGGFTYNGVHYSGDAANIAQGDNFLSIVVAEIEASAAFQNNGAIVIWNDETEGGDTSGFTSTEIVISPLAKGNAYDSTITYDHPSDSRLGLSCLASLLPPMLPARW